MIDDLDLNLNPKEDRAIPKLVKVFKEIARDYCKENKIPLGEPSTKFAFFAMVDEPRKIVRVIDWGSVQKSRRVSIYIREKSNFCEIELKSGTKNYLNIEAKGHEGFRISEIIYNRILYKL